ncbi:MAG: hypothetical protein HQ542_00835 [Bacteroidia bacterium]|nr:hypothetical protein [Bacteroidia bacterium]
MNKVFEKQMTKYINIGEDPVELPQALDIEEVLLGAIILEGEKDIVKTVIKRLQTCYFHKNSHRIIFNAIKDLHDQTLPIDLLTVTEQCRKNQCLEEIGGACTISKLAFRICSSAHIDYWFKIIYQKYMQREIIRIGKEKIDQAFRDSKDCFDLLDEFISELKKLYPFIFKTVSTTASDLAEEMLKEIQVLRNQGKTAGNNTTLIYLTGWNRFDKIVSLSKDKIILIAGAAKAGKSRFIRTILFNLLERYSDISV